MKKVCIILSVALTLFIATFFQESVEAKTVKKGGYYYTVLQGHKPDYESGYIKKFKIKGNKIITYGSFSYGKNEWGGKMIKKKKRTFKLSNKCKYWDGWGVPGGKRKISKGKALKLMKSYFHPTMTATCCIFKVKKGKIVKFMMGQA